MFTTDNVTIGMEWRSGPVAGRYGCCRNCRALAFSLL